MSDPLRFAVGLLVAGALLVLALRLAARRLSCARPDRALAAAVLAALLPVAWVLGSGRTLAPTGDLSTLIPGVSIAAGASDPYDRGLNDAVLQFLPWEHEVRRALFEGRLPFWSDRLGTGDDLWANPQAQVASPLAWLARLVPLEHHLLAACALRVLAGFAGAALLARRFGLRRPLDLLCGAAYGWGGATLGFAIFPHGGTGAVVPWLALAGLHLARDRRRAGRRPRGRITAALLTAAAALGGHPVTGLGAALAAALFALAGRRRGDSRRTALAALALPLFAGAALSAPWNLPFLIALNDAAPPALVSPAAAAAGTLWYERPPATVTAALIAPFPAGALAGAPGRAWHPAVAVYSGLWLVPGLVLALVVPSAAKRRRIVPLLLFGAVIWIAALAPPIWLGWKAALPILRSLQIPRLAPALLLAWIVAGACGLARLRGPRRRLPLVALGIAATLDYGVFVARALPRGEPAALYPESPLLKALAAASVATPARVAATGYRLYPSIGAVYGLDELRPNNTPLVQVDLARALDAGLGFVGPDRAYFSTLARPDHPLLDFLNVGYLIAGAREAPPPGMAPWREPGADELVVLRNREALPRWFVAKRTGSVAAPALANWIRALDAGDRVALDPADGPWAGTDNSLHQGPGFEAVETLRAGDGAISLRLAPAVAPRLLATSHPHWRGWSARSESAPLRTRRVQGAFLGVEVPPEVREVDLAYRPPGLTGGFAIAICGVLLLAADSRRGRRWLFTLAAPVREKMSPP